MPDAYPGAAAPSDRTRRPYRTSSEPHESRRQGGATTLPVLLLVVFSLVGALMAGLMPQTGQTQFAVIAAPWKGLDGMAGLVAAADGRIVDGGRLPNVIFAQSDRPGFAAALYRAGAWLVLDPVLLRGCLGSGGRSA